MGFLFLQILVFVIGGLQGSMMAAGNFDSVSSGVRDLTHRIYIRFLDRLRFLCSLKGPSKRSCVISNSSCDPNDILSRLEGRGCFFVTFARQKLKT